MPGRHAPQVLGAAARRNRVGECGAPFEEDAFDALGVRTRGGGASEPSSHELVDATDWHWRSPYQKVELDNYTLS